MSQWSISNPGKVARCPTFMQEPPHLLHEKMINILLYFIIRSITVCPPYTFGAINRSSSDESHHHCFITSDVFVVHVLVLIHTSTVFLYSI